MIFLRKILLYYIHCSNVPVLAVLAPNKYSWKFFWFGTVLVQLEKSVYLKPWLYSKEYHFCLNRGLKVKKRFQEILMRKIDFSYKTTHRNVISNKFAVNFSAIPSPFKIAIFRRDFSTNLLFLSFEVQNSYIWQAFGN